MQIYDIIMLVVLVGTALFGAWKGMAWQLAALASVVLSAAVAIQCSAGIALYCPGQEPWNRFIAMLLLYVLTAAAIWILFRFVSGIIDRIQLKEFDRQLGVLFGLVKGILYCLIITFFAVTLSENCRRVVLQSRSGEFIAQAIRHANPFLPEDIRVWLGRYIDELDEKLHAPLPEEPLPDNPLPVE